MRLADRLRVRYEHLDLNSGNIEFAGGRSFCTPQGRLIEVCEATEAGRPS